MTKLSVPVAAVLVLGAVIYYGIHSRTAAASRLIASTDAAAVTIVDVTHPNPDAPAAELILPGNTEAFTSAPIFARTSGYLTRWYVDIGARVTQGQLLAELETPELDQQLRQARADLATVESMHTLAEITATRSQTLLATHSVSTQERDNAVHGQAASLSTVESHRANVARLEQLQSFGRIRAPFAGVITARNTDVGALVDAGASARQGLFRLGAIDRLRVYVPVPEQRSRAAATGLSVDLTLDEFPGRRFPGKVARNAGAIDTAAHTLLVEVDVDNPGAVLLPGAYVQVHFPLHSTSRSVTVPANALLFRAEGLRVGVVRDGRVKLVAIVIGHDYGNTLEVVSGLDANDAVVLDPPDSLADGAVVDVRPAAAGVSR
ncbi:MAG: efflux transporter, family, subunit [Acidobacteria bacterium]|nr:efflux transporter, family, subunit [Acidobacteriota bacterium]